MRTRLLEYAHKTPPASTTALNLLVVDDDHLQRMTAREVLTHAGHRVSEQDSGELALEWLETSGCDAVLLDACMPGLNGFDTCRRIREELCLSGLPVIIATGLEDEGSIEKAFASGASDYIIKPINWKLLHHRLHALVETERVGRRVNDIHATSQSLLEGSPDTLLRLDSEAVITECRGSEGLPRAIAPYFRDGYRLFDTLPEAAVDAARNAWNRLYQNHTRQSFLISERSSDASYFIKAWLLPGRSGQVLCILRDYTELHLAEQRILDLSCFDPITGLANTEKVTATLEAKIRQPSAAKHKSGVIRCVIENYRTLSRRLSLDGMQQLAIQLAQRLLRPQQDSCGCQITVGRLSDNEYVLLVFGLKDMIELHQLAVQLHTRLSSVYPVNDCNLLLTFSIGLATTDEVGKNAGRLLDAAAYACNDESTGVEIRCYSDQIRRDVMKHNAMERLLLRDIEAGRLSIQYQPKYSLDGLALMGMEALVRWQSDELGSVSPEQFIPLAEKSGLMQPLTDLVIAAVLDQAQQWQQQGFACVPISINVPGPQLAHQSFVKQLNGAIVKRHLSTGWVELEVTESILITSDSSAIANLREFQKLGIRIAIDDFGTGYSSFSYLKELPVEVLKIDMSFIHTIHTDDAAAAIVRAIITVGHDLGLIVVAEGVEHRQQLERLRELGCDAVQGYYTGRPQPAEQIILAPSN